MNRIFYLRQLGQVSSYANQSSKCFQLRLTSTIGETKPRITVPHRMVRRIEKTNIKNSIQSAREKHFYLLSAGTGTTHLLIKGASSAPGRGSVLIACKRSQFNHRVGQVYRDLNPDHLASKGWKHARSKGDYFSINACRSNPAFDYEDMELNSDVSSFKHLGLDKRLVDALTASNIVSPTNIQAKTIPTMISGKNVLCTAETGSGKTLAYLLPILEGILRQNSLYGSCSIPNKPYAFVLAPSRELANQIHNVLLNLAQSTGINVDLKYGGERTQHLLRTMPVSLVDVVVSTPGVLTKLLSNRFYNLSRLSFIVIDEADTLLDDSFNDLTTRILQKLKVVSEMPVSTLSTSRGQTGSTQIALVGATLPLSLKTILGDIVPLDTIESVSTNFLHRVMPHVVQKFVRVGPSQRNAYLLDQLKTSSNKNNPTIVFCNSSSTVCHLGYFLESSGIKNIILHSRMPQVIRKGRYEKFLEGQADVLICTDVASRGLDTVKVRKVINYEFPNFMSDYVHRVGRVGRVGSEGGSLAISLISYPWDVELLWKIETAARKNEVLHNVNANIKRTLTYRHKTDSSENSSPRNVKP